MLRSGGVLRITVLQQMAIIHHQRRLAILAKKIRSEGNTTNEDMDQVQKVLNDYIKT